MFTYLRTQVASHWRGPHLLYIVVQRWLSASTVFILVILGLNRSDRRDELLIGTWSPHVPNKPYVASVDVKHREKKKKDYLAAARI